MSMRTVYHGSQEIVEYPEIRTHKYNKDFYFGFYCTEIKEQAIRWATRHGNTGYINVYRYIADDSLNIKVFPEMSEGGSRSIH